MDRLNKTLAISLTTLTLAGSAPQIFAARTNHGASKQTGTSSSKKTDYTKPILNSTGHCIRKIEELVGEILPKIEEYNKSKCRAILNDIYDLVKENNIWFRNIFDFPSSEQEKIETINNFVREALKSDINKLHKILKSQNSDLLARKKDFLMKIYGLLDTNMIHYLPKRFFLSDDCADLINVVKRLKEEAAEQERLAKQKKEQERLEKLEQERLEKLEKERQEILKQERKEKQCKLKEAITEICGCIKKYKGWESENNLNNVYKAILNNIHGNKISFGDDLKIQTYQENDSNLNPQKNEVEEFLFNLVEKDIPIVSRYFDNPLSSKYNIIFDKSSRLPKYLRNPLIRIRNLCNVNQVLGNYIMNNYINKIREENVEKFKRIENFIYPKIKSH